MASAGLREELECSICLNLYTDPVTLRCGHNFCRVCIDRVLDTQDQSGVYSCPECREEFQVRPALKKNITLCNVVENFLSTHRDDARIFCTYCIHSPVPAVKSCLHCEASLCDDHLRTHNKSPEHVLSDPRTSLEKKKCSVHKKILEYYCTEDAASICVSCCLIGEHNGHKMESLDQASKNKKTKLRDVLQKLTTKREETEGRVQSVKERRRKAQEKASGEAERVTALFVDIRRRLDDLEKRVLSEISRQEKEESLSLSTLIHQLEIKKDELSRKMRHIEELCNMTDPLTVLQDPDTDDLKTVTRRDITQKEGFKFAPQVNRVFVSPDQMKSPFGSQSPHQVKSDFRIQTPDQMKSLFGPPYPPQVKSDFGIQPPDLMKSLVGSQSPHQVKSDFGIQSPHQLKFDFPIKSPHQVKSPFGSQSPHQVKSDFGIQSPNNVNIGFGSQKLGKVQCSSGFQDSPQVMSSRRFSSGRHYWDVEISGSGQWTVGMCYPSIDRRGHQSVIGNNNKSWGLCRRGDDNQYSVRHDSKEIQLPHKISSNIFRISLDYGAGQLSFYELCDPIRLLHTFTTTFTEPLHAALWVGEGSLMCI